MTSQTAMADLTTSKLVVVAGKGGVGKTTVTAVLARAAAEAGRRVLVIDLDGTPSLQRLLPGIEVRHISARSALEEYLSDHGFRRMAKRLAKSGVVEVTSTAAPGVGDLVVLGKIKQLERSGDWDLIVVDGPAAGHAVTFLTTPAGLRDAVRGGPIGDQADDVLALLADPARCSIVLVTLPETTPVNELLETADALRERVGADLAGVVVNQVDMGPLPPDPDGVELAGSAARAAEAREAAGFRRTRIAGQAGELGRVREVFDRVVILPRLPTADLTADAIAELVSRDRGET